VTRTIRLVAVPDALYATLAARAARRGLSLPDYLLEEFRRIAARPDHLAQPRQPTLSRVELYERLQSRSRVDLGTSATAILRREHHDE
jgi:hypothetical protein